MTYDCKMRLFNEKTETKKNEQMTIDKNGRVGVEWRSVRWVIELHIEQQPISRNELGPDRVHMV